jgi:hypothetical protein
MSAGLVVREQSSGGITRLHLGFRPIAEATGMTIKGVDGCEEKTVGGVDFVLEFRRQYSVITPKSQSIYQIEDINV